VGGRAVICSFTMSAILHMHHTIVIVTDKTAQRLQSCRHYEQAPQQRLPCSLQGLAESAQAEALAVIATPPEVYSNFCAHNSSQLVKPDQVQTYGSWKLQAELCQCRMAYEVATQTVAAFAVSHE